ncbi:MAG: DegT/DnrJ/EryC1/StrS family aminotransferase [Candidatus Paraimprobicoccus trichonymphae]|uniref:DegT/DnrJ/EryC1/StrS family aminotransferase n=1 Tax=Candidatus Paraimprobicoccus trichonymphae TaxID=3033793 RepID=A0AA48I4Q7_9FIRM|nr:MAG: DegT/DnrJ/EryC1/StrS family aminotransferase [Candidatus Paraimprobicoccus trichonymphae]
MINFSVPDITDSDISEVISTLKSGWITTGPKTKLLEKNIAEFCGTKKAVCLNSATACMEITLKILGITENDEIATSSYTYSASCSVICHVGAIPVLIDTKKDSFEMNYEKLFEKINEKTKVIIPVDFAGIMCDYNKIFEIVNLKKNLFKPNNKIQESIGRIIILSDSAHAFGASQKEKMCGQIADFTSFSFHAVKNLTCAEGGAVTWKSIKNISDDDIYKKYMLWSLHGQSKDALDKYKNNNWEYNIIYTGYKCNMTDVLASIGLSQLKRYKNSLKIRKNILDIYNNELKNENLQILKHSGENFKSSNHLYIVRLLNKDDKFRNNLIKNLFEDGISTNVHYKPLPMFTAYKNLGFDMKDFKNSYDMYKNEITLPLYSTLKNIEIEYITEKFKFHLNK